MRIVCLSDTHGFHESLSIPDGDVLIHAGDFTLHGEMAEIALFDEFLGDLPHPTKLVVAGNHDFPLQNHPEEAEALLENAIYLKDSAYEIDGIKFWGSPWQPWFMDMAFNLKSTEELAAVWQRIPEDTDVVITHTPPKNILDLTSLGIYAGCEALTERLAALQPKLHVFGHIHEGHGTQTEGNTTYVNACNCTLQYEPVQAPIVVTV